MKRKRRPLYADMIPAPDEIRAYRGGLTQAEAATIVYVSWRTWQVWESGRSAMPPGLWELCQIKGVDPESGE